MRCPIRHNQIQIIIVRTKDPQENCLGFINDVIVFIFGLFLCDSPNMIYSLDGVQLIVTFSNLK